MEKKYRLEKLANTNESEIGNIGENGKRNHNTQHEAGSNVSIEKVHFSCSYDLQYIMQRNWFLIR